MKYIYSLLLCVITVVDAQSRIVAGTVVEDDNAYPFMVSLRTSVGKHFCGGAIIAPQWILSAAHCFPKPFQPTFAVVGTHQLIAGGIAYSIMLIAINGYDSNTNIHDIALLKVSVPIVYSASINSIELPNGSPFIDPLLPMSTLIGWGNTIPQTSISALSINLLQIFMKAGTCDHIYTDFNKNTQLCMISYSFGGPCVGDSGGPLIYEGKLIGLVSYGGQVCAIVPTVFTDVSKYFNYIQDVMAANA